MSRTFHRFLKFFKNKWVIAGLVVLIIFVFYIFKKSQVVPVIQTSVATIGDVVEKVSVTGTVSPVDKSDLAFGKSGVLTQKLFKVGDSVKKGQLIASIDSAGDVAALESAKAQLDDASRNLTPQELAVQKSALDSAKINAINAVHDGYVKAQSSVVNYIDNVFNYPQSANPTIIFSTDSNNQQSKINFERLVVTDAFNKWNNSLATLTSDNVSGFLPKVNEYLASIKSLENDVSIVVARLNAGSSGYSQNQIDSYVTTTNTALATLSAAMDTVTSAQTALNSAQSAYDLKLSGNSEQSIAALSAKVEQAQAMVSSNRIYAPFDGIITKADPNVGEFVSAGGSSFAIQSFDDYKIEAFVPEADIAKISVGNIASSTLDAYGSNTDFPAMVTIIDPAETVIQGVPTYKVTLRFTSPDSRIRSGMTTNLEILSHERNNVITIPYRALSITSTSTTVRILNSDKKTFSTVTVVAGLKGSDGTIEIVSGLSEGDKVVTYVK